MGHLWTTASETRRGSALEGLCFEVRMRCMQCMERGREAAYHLSEAEVQARSRQEVRRPDRDQ